MLSTINGFTMMNGVWESLVQENTEVSLKYPNFTTTTTSKKVSKLIKTTFLMTVEQ